MQVRGENGEAQTRRLPAGGRAPSMDANTTPGQEKKIWVFSPMECLAAPSSHQSQQHSLEQARIPETSPSSLRDINELTSETSTSSHPIPET